MNRYFTALAAALVAGLPVLAGPVSAQSTELSAEEITEAFEKQKTRGLVIVPSSGTGMADTTGAVATDTAATAAAADPTNDVTTVYNEVDSGMPEVNVQISFDFNSAALRNDQKPKLDTMCQVMQGIDVSVFQIIGHTDSSGSADYNQRLSLLRAQEVKRHLVRECGIAETRLRAIGVGESAPLNTANTRADENRRVEFQALG